MADELYGGWTLLRDGFAGTGSGFLGVSIFWAELLMLQGFEVYRMVKVVHAKSVIFAVIGFEAFFVLAY